MAVRVKLQIKSRNKTVETSAIANAGYETDENEIIIPKLLAKKLALKPGKKRRYRTINGEATLFTAGEVTVKTITKDKESEPITAKALISLYEEEAIINDKLTETLKIQLLKVKTGIWRFSDDATNIERVSEEKQTW